MKKTLVALAAVSAVSAFAQSTVSIAGNIDIAAGTKAVWSGNGALFGKATGIMDGLNTPNRIFIRVEEDLGGGLKAKFQNEHGISPTNAQDWTIRQNNAAPTYAAGGKASTTDPQIPADAVYTTGTNRGTYLALESASSGELRAGYLVSALYNAAAQSGYFMGSENYGALLQVHGMTEAGGSRANGIDYKSPKIAGVFTLGIQKQYGAERSFESANTTVTTNTLVKAERTAYRLDFNNGPINAVYVRTDYETVTNQNTGLAAGASAPSIFGVASSASTTAAAGTNVSHDHFGTSYETGPLKVVYQFNRASQINNVTASSSREFKANQFQGQYTMGAASVFLITGKGTVDSPSARVNNLKNTQYGVRYNLSKRTTGYFMAGSSSDTVPTSADKMSKGTMSGIGLSHSF